MPRPRFSIIIVTWDGLRHLKSCVPTVLRASHPSFEVLVADNASRDGSQVWVKGHYPKVKLVPLDRNYGFCGGNNRAVPYATGEILVFLNNDVEVDEHWLEPLDRAFARDLTLVAAQPKLLHLRDRSKFEYAGAAGGYLDRYGYPFCRGRIFDAVEEDLGQYDDSVEILWASGAALAVRRREFVEAGGFDEDFQFHMEEIDLCWRLINLGYRVESTPASRVFHEGAASLPAASHRKFFYNYRNNLILLWKNLTSKNLARRFPVRLTLDALAAVRALATGRWVELLAIARAHGSFLLRWRSTHMKRRRLERTRVRLQEPETMIDSCIVKEHFLRGLVKFSDLGFSRTSSNDAMLSLGGGSRGEGHVSWKGTRTKPEPAATGGSQHGLLPETP